MRLATFLTGRLKLYEISRVELSLTNLSDSELAIIEAMLEAGDKEVAMKFLSAKTVEK